MASEDHYGQRKPMRRKATAALFTTNTHRCHRNRQPVSRGNSEHRKRNVKFTYSAIPPHVGITVFNAIPSHVGITVFNAIPPHVGITVLNAFQKMPGPDNSIKAAQISDHSTWRCGCSVNQPNTHPQHPVMRLQ